MVRIRSWRNQPLWSSPLLRILFFTPSKLRRKQACTIDTGVTSEEGMLLSFQKSMIGQWVQWHQPLYLRGTQGDLRIVLLTSKCPTFSAGPVVVLLPGLLCWSCCGPAPRPRPRALIRFPEVGYLSMQLSDPPVWESQGRFWALLPALTAFCAAGPTAVF